MHILILNAGSGSQKIALYALEHAPGAEPPRPLWEGYADWNAQPGRVVVHLQNNWGFHADESLTETARPAVLRHLLTRLWDGDVAAISSPSEVSVVGHRVVHAGPTFRQSTRVTPAVREAIQDFETVAGAHNRLTLEGMAIADAIFGDTPQVAAFDTAFHRTMPAAMTIYPGPYAWYEQGIKRYGFHGLSHHYGAERAAQLLNRELAELRIITCHLGGGCSVAAIQGGQSVNTTMGFTPLEGLVMNNRSGTVDPGILLYLMRYKGYSAEQLDRELHEQSGLLGISGITNDLRGLLEGPAAQEPRAQLAVAIFVQRLREDIGAMLTTLGGVDVLVFTGGVGEHLPPIRAAACATLGFLGLELDEAQNAAAQRDVEISTPHSRVRVLMVQAQEEWMIARDCWAVQQAS